MAPTPVLLPGKSHEQMSLVGYSPWGCKKDRIEQLKNNNNQIIYWSVYLSSVSLSIHLLSTYSLFLSSICPSIHLSYLSTFYLPILSTYYLSTLLVLFLWRTLTNAHIYPKDVPIRPRRLETCRL